MRYFSIRDLERISDIKAHTIRAWEVRYNVFLPQRTPSNIRYYTVEDLRHLLNIATLIEKGYRISKLASATKQQLEGKILSLKTAEDKKAKSINDLLISMFLEDIDKFEELLNKLVALWGIDDTLRTTILPFLQKANILSYESSSADIHFVVTAVRKKIILGIESLDVQPAGPGRALLFLFKNEHYDLMLLYINYLLKAQGIHVLYLGTNVSAHHLEPVLSDKRPTMLVTYTAAARHPGEKIYADLISARLPGSKLYVFHPPSETQFNSDCTNVVCVDLKAHRFTDKFGASGSSATGAIEKLGIPQGKPASAG